MSQPGIELLEAYEALPLAERQAFAVEILRRTRDLPFDSSPISDQEIGDAGRSLFAFLDQQENSSTPR